MTVTVTKSEIPSTANGRVPVLDSPAVSTRARARVPVTVGSRKIGTSLASMRVIAARGCRRWWAWTARPLSLRAAWRTSAIDPKRVPLRRPLLVAVWRVSNATDRIVMFALVLLAPTVLTGPLRWLAARPTRRAGFYLAAAAAAVYVLVGHLAGKE